MCEEAFGRYLDLHEFYNKYVNSKFGELMEYSAYLDVFSQPEKIPHKLKMISTGNTCQHLISFFQQTEPLKDLDRIFSKLMGEFEEQWPNGEVEGWENDRQENRHVPSQHMAIDLDYYSTVEVLMEVGPEQLKEALAALGLKTGRTVRQRAERIFLTKNTPLEKLDKKHFAKPPRVAEQNGDVAAPYQENVKEISLMEAKMKRPCELLNEVSLFYLFGCSYAFIHFFDCLLAN
ncbi:hypothetical protein Ancab_009930 [Ancistrocladus abbreviatus]